MGRPILDHQIDLVRSRGCEEVIITTSHHCDGLFVHLDSADFGPLRVFCAVEEQALGTAGGVRNAGDMLRDTFFVLSGDAFTDVDIAPVVDFHRKRKALVTIMVKRVSDVRPFGMVAMDGRGRVVHFEEKPQALQAPVSHLANTGMYIMEPEALELVPRGAFFDFAHHLFPLMLQAGMPIMGYEIEGYWRDVGTLPDYHGAHRDALGRRLEWDPGHLMGHALDSGDAVEGLHPSATIEGPVFIGQGAVVEEGAYLGPFTSIAPNARIGRNARVTDSVVNSEVSVGPESRVRRSIIGRRTAVPRGSHLESAAVNAYITVGIRRSAADRYPPSLAGRRPARSVPA
jgi:mannose-1-phosphate guanylyltransferase/phosphomannomutase